MSSLGPTCLQSPHGRAVLTMTRASLDAPPGITRRGFARQRLPLWVLAAVGGVFLCSVQHQPTLQAAGNATSGQPDLDHDGLDNYLELVHGLNPIEADSDGDGYSDAEELARHSDPLDALVIPALQSVDVGIEARAKDGVVTTITAIYSWNGRLRNVLFGYGAVIAGQQIPLSPANYMANSAYRIVNTADGRGRIFLLETSFPASLVRNLGGLSIYATVVDMSSVHGNAAGLNLVDFSGVTMAVEPLQDDDSGGSGGFTYKPLSTGDDLPSNFTPGQICVQFTSTVGATGASTLEEVTSAGCEDAESSCSGGDCSATIGDTIEMVDPGGLIGG